jgi:hypothetical protein
MRDKFDHAKGWFLKAESDLHTVKRLLVVFQSSIDG